jgi:hypothetical protein
MPKNFVNCERITIMSDNKDKINPISEIFKNSIEKRLAQVPRPGEVWEFEVFPSVSEEVFVTSRSRFWSWLYKDPYYWCAIVGGRNVILVSINELLWRVYPEV